MKHTKESLAAMSDFEVNKALAWLVMMVIKKETWTFNDNKSTVQFFNEDTKKSRVIDYCNNPSDIMPLAFDHKISIEHVIASDSGYWLAGSNTYYHFADENPLRAAACCLILVLQSGEE